MIQLETHACVNFNLPGGLSTEASTRIGLEYTTQLSAPDSETGPFDSETGLSAPTPDPLRQTRLDQCFQFAGESRFNVLTGGYLSLCVMVPPSCLSEVSRACGLHSGNRAY